MANEEKVTSSPLNPQETQLSDFDLIVRGEHSDAFAILGPHWIDANGKRSLAIRVFRPNATEVTVIGSKNKESCAASRMDPEGLFEAIIPAPAFGVAAGDMVPPTAYRLRIRFSDGNVLETLDPYAFPLRAHRIRFVFIRGRHPLPEI